MMPVGVISNSLAVFFGGIIGGILGPKIPERLRSKLPLTFGIASMSMGIINIIKIETLPAVVLALIIGTAIGELIYLENIITKVVEYFKRIFDQVFMKNKIRDENDKEEFMQQFITIVVLFTASGTGIYGSLTEGMTGNPTILFTKSILDFCTAVIFGSSLGYLVSTISIPQFIVLILLFLSAKFIIPITTPRMISDFSACGGMIMLASGFRICGIKLFPTANMIPALILVMPISSLLSNFIV